MHLTLGGLLTSEQVRVGSAAGWSEHQGWDHEQTAWFRWVFEETRRLPDLKEPPESPVDLFTPSVLFNLGEPTVWHVVDPEQTHHDDGSPVYDHSDPPPPPPEQPPEATLRSVDPVSGAFWSITGLRVWQRWIVAEQLETFETKLPYPWPEPTPIASREIEIAWESPAPPESVQVNVFRSIGADDRPGPAAVKRWCEHRPFADGCTLALNPAGQAWVVRITLPPEPGPCFVATHAAWSLPHDSPIHDDPGWPCFDATCIFALECT